MIPGYPRLIDESVHLEIKYSLLIWIDKRNSCALANLISQADTIWAMRCFALDSWGLIAIDELYLNGSIISREYGELSSSEGDRFSDIFLGHLHRK